MPVWFKCSNCGQKYYTAASEYNLQGKRQCEKCSSRLRQIVKNVKNLLDDVEMMEIEPCTTEEEIRARCARGKVAENIITLAVEDGQKLKETIKAGDEVAGNFTARERRPGRYFFESEVKSLNETFTSSGETAALKVQLPEFVYRRQERRAPRVEFETEVEYRLVKDKEDFDEIVQGRGKSVDVSPTGLLFTDYIKRPELLDESRKVQLRIDLDEGMLDLKGRIARVTELKEDDQHGDYEGNLGIGVEFIDMDEEEKERLYKLS